MTRRFISHEGGAVAVIVALLTPFLLAGLAFAIETGLWFMTQRKLQHSADSAAYAAAVVLASGDTQARAAAVARESALGSGFDPARGQITVNFPTENRAQVLLQTSRLYMFLRAVDFLRDDGERRFDEAQMIAARAVAEVRRDDDPDEALPVCLMAMAQQGLGLDIGGNAALIARWCTIEVHSGASPAMRVRGSARITAACVTARGTIDGVNAIETNPAFCEEPRQNTTPMPLPPALRDLPRPSNPGSVPNQPLGNNETTITATHTGHPSGVPMRRFQGGLNLGRDDYVFQPGLYIIDGGRFRTSNGTTIDATQGVAFYLINGAYLDFHSGSSASFRGLPAGRWAGLIFFDGNDSASAQSHSVVVDEMEGVIFLPRATFDFSGGNDIDDGCFVLVADSFRFAGGSSIEANCDNAEIDLDWVFQNGGNGEGPVTGIYLIE